jgi:hypothetical protein
MIIVASYMHVFAALGFLMTLIFLLCQIAALPDVEETVETVDDKARETSVTDMLP